MTLRLLSNSTRLNVKQTFDRQKPWLTSCDLINRENNTISTHLCQFVVCLPLCLMSLTGENVLRSLLEDVITDCVPHQGEKCFQITDLSLIFQDTSQFGAKTTHAWFTKFQKYEVSLGNRQNKKNVP